jgi:hypothetical protein
MPQHYILIIGNSKYVAIENQRKHYISMENEIIPIACHLNMVLAVLFCCCFFGFVCGNFIV